MNEITYIILVILFWGIILFGLGLIQWEIWCLINKANNRYRKYHIGAFILVLFAMVKVVIECINMIQTRP